MVPLLACTESAFFDSVIASLLVFLLFKPVVYVAFVLAFRYRVSAEHPLSWARILTIAAVRAVAGLLIIGGCGLFMRFALDMDTTGSTQTIIQTIVTGERLVLWAALGWGMARLRGRRLLGWTLSGAAIDLGYDLALDPACHTKIGPIIAMTALVMLCIGLLLAVGRRSELRDRFTRNRWCMCGYDPTGNISGICPECGKPVSPESDPAKPKSGTQ